MSRTTITALHVQRVKELAAQKTSTKQIARNLCLAESTVTRIRQGWFDELIDPDRDPSQREIAWCPRCRCHVFPPCQACRLREHCARRALHAALPRTAPRCEAADPQLRQRLSLSIAALGLPVRTVNYLQGRGILTVNDVLHHTADDLLRIPNFGRKTLNQVLLGLARLGFTAASESSQSPRAA